MGFNQPTNVPAASHITNRSKDKRPKDAPCKVEVIYQDPTQPCTIPDAGCGVPGVSSGTTSGEDSSQLAISDEGDYIVSSDPSDPPDLDRHSRRCCICSHPDRDAIEGEFVRWKSPRNIAKAFQIADRASFYRHAHATGLFARRRREFARVLEDILECVEDSSLAETADVIIRASRVYARLDENGIWVEPTRTHVILTGPAPPQSTGNPGLEISVEPRRRQRDIPFKPASRLANCKKANKRLIATHPNSKNRPTR